MKPWIVCLSVLASVAPSGGSAHAESGEITVGVHGGVLIPSLSTQDSASLTLATFAAGPVASYGVLDDLFVQLRGHFSFFSGASAESRDYLGRELTGTLSFDATQIGVETGARYDLFPGYDLTPYVEAHVGYVWLAYRNLQFRDPEGRDFGLDTPDLGEGGLSLSAGVHADYRIVDLLFVGVGARISKVFSDRYQYFIEVPLEVQFFF